MNVCRDLFFPQVFEKPSHGFYLIPVPRLYQLVSKKKKGGGNIPKIPCKRKNGGIQEGDTQQGSLSVCSRPPDVLRALLPGGRTKRIGDYSAPYIVDA